MSINVSGFQCALSALPIVGPFIAIYNNRCIQSDLKNILKSCTTDSQLYKNEYKVRLLRGVTNVKFGLAGSLLSLAGIIAAVALKVLGGVLPWVAVLAYALFALGANRGISRMQAKLTVLE